MPLTRITNKGITDNAVNADKLAPGSVTTAKVGCSAIESSEINDGSVAAADLSPSLDLSSKTVTLAGSTVESLKRPIQDNIALLGFKMAVNDGLTVFNLVDGVVDEFHDESGTDESEGSNDNYNSSSDYYVNSTSPTGTTFCSPACASAGFSTTAITEPDTSVAGTNPAQGAGTYGKFTVPAGMTSINLALWGAGGGTGSAFAGGAGGYTSGTLAVTPGQVLEITVGEGGIGYPQSTGAVAEAAFGGASNGTTAPSPDYGNSGISLGAPHGYDNNCQGGGGMEGGPGNAGYGGGLTGIFTADCLAWSTGAPVVPSVALIAGAGGGGTSQYGGGGGGGLTGDAGGTVTETVQGRNAIGGFPTGAGSAGGGDQEQGGDSGDWAGSTGENGYPGFLFSGGHGGGGGGSGGAGYYGGGGASQGPQVGNTIFAGGGGSAYYGHPQITSGATEEGGPSQSGGHCKTGYITGVGGSGPGNPGGCNQGGDGYVILSGAYCVPVSGTPQATTIVSTAFTAASVPTSARIVVFEEDVQTPTLNTHIIASVSRDGGSTYTNATLSDSGYVTGSSGQRILTGQATISGQPSGQSMRWKLALSTNAVRIHGVALQWA